jgi:8-oxo-dGTP pyrophosphatase MutT (NUDIX family)
MASLGLGTYVLVVLTVGGSKASSIKLALHREPHTSTDLFPAGSILPNEELVDGAVRELLEEDGLTLTHDDLTLLRINPVRVSLLEGKYELVYVFWDMFRYPS